MIRMNHFYLGWEQEDNWQGYDWLDFKDGERSVISYFRKNLLCIHNFTPEFHENYWIFCDKIKAMREVFSTDSEEFGGSNQVNLPIHLDKDGFTVNLAPLATMIFEVEFA